MAEQDKGKTPTAVADTTKAAGKPAATTTATAEVAKAKGPLAPAPELTPAGKAMVAAALKANGGKFPVKHYPVKVAFGHEYPAREATDHTVDWVQKLVWELRTSADKPSYRSIAEALDIQCSAITEAVTHGYARKAKVKDDSWKVATGGRVKFLQEQEAVAAKPSKSA